VTAGALFIGPYSPTVLGDYVAGPSHTLPTGGAGTSFAGLTVDQFQRRTSIVEYSPAALKKSLRAVHKFAEVAGLDAHAGAAAIPVPLQPDFALPSKWNFNAPLTFITTPNAPSGRGYTTAELERICGVHRGALLLDEAYADFTNENALELALKCPNVLVAR